MSPVKGPPLPNFLDIFWPWYEGAVITPPTIETPTTPTIETPTTPTTETPTIETPTTPTPPTTPAAAADIEFSGISIHSINNVPFSNIVPSSDYGPIATLASPIAMKAPSGISLQITLSGDSLNVPGNFIYAFCLYVQENPSNTPAGAIAPSFKGGMPIPAYNPFNLYANELYSPYGGYSNTPVAWSPGIYDLYITITVASASDPDVRNVFTFMVEKGIQA
jgi:hypothetical protein